MEKEENILGYEKIGKLIRKFSIPCIISLLVNSLYNIVDQIFIGWGVGYLGNGATNVVFPLTMICLAFALMFGDGASAYLSLKLGQKKNEEAAKGIGNGISLSVIISIILFTIIELFLPTLLNVFGCTDEFMSYALSYGRIIGVGLPFMIIGTTLNSMIRADGKPKYAMTSMVIGAILNVILDPIFIFAFKKGVEGAAIATVIARIIETMIILIYVYKKSNLLNINFSHIKMLDFKFIKVVYAGMLPVLINEFVWGLGNLTYNVIYARMGVGTAAAIQVTSTVMNLLMIVIIGLGNSAMVIVGKEIGAKREDLGKLYAKRLYKFALIIAIIIATVIFLTANDFVYFFKMSATVLNDTKRILYVNAILLLIRSYTFIMIVGVLRGAGDSKYAVKIQGLTLWTIGIPMAFIGAFILNLEVYYVVALTGMEEIVKYIFIRRRFKSGKWIHNMTN